jgi:hypothetical protein
MTHLWQTPAFVEDRSFAAGPHTLRKKTADGLGVRVRYESSRSVDAVRKEILTLLHRGSTAITLLRVPSLLLWISLLRISSTTALLIATLLGRVLQIDVAHIVRLTSPLRKEDQSDDHSRIRPEVGVHLADHHRRSILEQTYRKSLECYR